MNIVEAIRIVLKDAYGIGNIQFPPAERHITVIAAQSEMMTVLNGYNELAPNWSKAPEWAQWYTINSGPENDCEATWHSSRPDTYSLGWVSYGECDTADCVDLPLGIDWRLCKWQRPQEAAA